jgi:S1-C subfamily serine protease
MRRFPTITALSVISLVTAAGVAAGVPSADLAPMRHASRAVVRVKSTVPLEGVPVRIRAEEASFTNTGFFVGTDGQVLTSLLGLAGCSQITVTGPDGRTAEAKVKAFDQPSGLALLSTGLTETVPFEPALECPPPGSPVYVAACGAAAEGTEPVLAPGVVAEGCRPIRIQGLEWEGLVLASCALKPGSAAAPVVDAEGRLMGVVIGAAASAPGEAGPGGSYVLPAAQLEPIMERLRAGQSRRLGWLGMIVATNREGGRGVAVLEVMQGAPAEQAGLRRGDVVLEMDGQALGTPAALAEQLTQADPGKEVGLLVKRREGPVQAIRATVGPRPLLICGGMGRPGGEVVRVRWRRSVGAVRVPDRTDGAEEVLFELFDENEALRNRVRELEEELEQLHAETDD